MNTGRAPLGGVLLGSLGVCKGAHWWDITSLISRRWFHRRADRVELRPRPDAERATTSVRLIVCISAGEARSSQVIYERQMRGLAVSL